MATHEIPRPSISGLPSLGGVKEAQQVRANPNLNKNTIRRDQGKPSNYSLSYGKSVAGNTNKTWSDYVRNQRNGMFLKKKTEITKEKGKKINMGSKYESKKSAMGKICSLRKENHFIDRNAPRHSWTKQKMM